MKSDVAHVNKFTSYEDKELLKQYEDDTFTNPFYYAFKDYTFNKILPAEDLKNKIILDCPSGICTYGLGTLNKGAKKVICSDLIQEQLDYGKSVFKKNNYGEERYELIQHNALDPKKITENLADIAISIHLYCYADNYQELVNFSKFYYNNIKEGGKLISYSCNMISEDKIQLFEELNGGKFIVYSKPITGDWPVKTVYRRNGFDYDSGLVNNCHVQSALKDAGFTKVEVVRFEIDPEYKGEIDLKKYFEVCEFEFLIAYKTID